MAASEPPRVTSRARKKKTVARVKPDKRVAHIVALMSKGEWYGYPTRIQLAERWGITESAVRGDAAEASRRLQCDPEQLEQDRLSAANWLMKQRLRAARERSLVTGLPDTMAAVRAIELELKCRRIDLDAPAPGPAGGETVTIHILADDSPEKAAK
jgi:hypothetical protein